MLRPNCLANYTHVITTSISKFSEVSCLRFRELYSHESNLWPKDYLYFNNSEVYDERYHLRYATLINFNLVFYFAFRAALLLSVVKVAPN